MSVNYRLAYYSTPAGIQRYGVVVTGQQPIRRSLCKNGTTHHRNCDSDYKPAEDSTTMVLEYEPRTPATDRDGRLSVKRLHNIRDTLFGVFLLGTLGLVIG